LTIANVAVSFFLLGATMVLTPVTFALAFDWIGENRLTVVKRGNVRLGDAEQQRTGMA
jgi:hypothetical protein